MLCILYCTLPLYRRILHHTVQGAEPEQLEAMLTPERYARYKELSRPGAEKTVKLGLLFRDILERERGKQNTICLCMVMYLSACIDISVVGSCCLYCVYCLVSVLGMMYIGRHV